MLAVALIVASAVIVRPTKGEAYFWVDFLVIGASIIAIQAATSKSRVLELPTLRWFGVISYGLYLWHGILVFEQWPDLGPVPGVVVAVAMSILIAWLSFRAIERPIVTWARRFGLANISIATTPSDPVAFGTATSSASMNSSVFGPSAPS